MVVDSSMRTCVTPTIFINVPRVSQFALAKTRYTQLFGHRCARFAYLRLNEVRNRLFGGPISGGPKSKVWKCSESPAVTSFFEMAFHNVTVFSWLSLMSAPISCIEYTSDRA